ncbi:hypothetical protein HanRHA438_Chr15g0729071 [Helianthus annuus]|uniref:Uncharacterized protein n=1 Tax=Helianthus annuus TaxID=4232 RepID=A0A9K3H6E7_HELAN|nr:hypothetical protein HanXRQr2_Chr15g0716911 [Helianthus annuus]KAJ0833226.1 hypothetical protein HanPSC8_Chr15g0687881 [Helianthus annuus]KAJ0846806.1 hypothetical protein HanRHA438_Chr15g0729071 [Helianthus annuus]
MNDRLGINPTPHEFLAAHCPLFSFLGGFCPLLQTAPNLIPHQKRKFCMISTTPQI